MDLETRVGRSDKVRHIWGLGDQQVNPSCVISTAVKYHSVTDTVLEDVYVCVDVHDEAEGLEEFRII